MALQTVMQIVTTLAQIVCLSTQFSEIAVATFHLALIKTFYIFSRYGIAIYN